MDRFNNSPEQAEIRLLSLQSLRRDTHRGNPGHDFGVKLAICQQHDNPADDLTRGKTLLELSKSQRCSQGPWFLHQHPNSWPSLPELATPDDRDELKKNYNSVEMHVLSRLNLTSPILRVGKNC